MKIRLASVIRILGFLLGGLVAISAALTLYVWISFDATAASDLLSRHIQTQYKRTLMMTGAPQLVVWPRPAIRLNKVSLKDGGRRESFASATELHVELAILPLLKNHFEITGLHASGVQLQLRQLPTGEWNLSDLLDAHDLSAPQGWSSQLRRIVIDAASVQIQALGRKGPLNLEGFDFSARLPDRGRPGKARWEGRLSDAQSETGGHFNGGTIISAIDGLRAMRLQGFSMEMDGDSHGLKGATVSLAARNLDWSDVASNGELDQLRLRVRGAHGERAIDFSTTWPHFVWQGRALSGTALDARLEIRTISERNETRLAIPTLTAEDPNGASTRGAQLFWLHDAGNGRRSSLQLEADAALNLLAGTLDASRLEGRLALEHPGLHQGSATAGLNGSFHWKPDGVTLQAQLAEGADALTLDTRLEPELPLKGRFTLESASLDLDRFLSTKPGKPPLSLPWLLPANATLDGQLKLAALRVGGVPVSSLQGQLKLDGDKLLADGLQARVHDGLISFTSLGANTANHQFSCAGEFKGLPLGAIALESGLPVPLGGKADGSFKLDGRLQPGHALAPTLDGAIRWSLSQASLRGVDIARGLHEMQASVLAGRMSARSPKPDELTDLGHASSRFVFASGVMTAENLQARSGWMTLSGSGQADLKRGDVDFRLAATLLPGAPKDLAPLRGKPLPLRIKGPAMQPDLRYEPLPAKAGK